MTSTPSSSILESTPFLSQSTHLSTFKIIVGDRIFFVNKHFLAELSPYFNALFFSSFQEATTECVTLEDIHPEDFEVLLRYLIPLDGIYNKTLTTDTAYLLFELAQRFDVPSVRSDIIKILNNEDRLRQFDDWELFVIDMITLCTRYKERLTREYLINVLERRNINVGQSVVKRAIIKNKRDVPSLSSQLPLRIFNGRPFVQWN